MGGLDAALGQVDGNARRYETIGSKTCDAAQNQGFMQRHQSQEATPRPLRMITRSSGDESLELPCR